VILETSNEVHSATSLTFHWKLRLRKGDVPATRRNVLDEIMANFEKDVIVSALDRPLPSDQDGRAIEDYASCFAL